MSDVLITTIYPNNYEHSRVRAYLNGLSYQKKTKNSAQESNEAFVNKGFFQTAFTQAEQDAIATTTVVNNARSTNPDSNDKQWNNGANPYASDTPTDDKIFLLSEQEAACLVKCTSKASCFFYSGKRECMV